LSQQEALQDYARLAATDNQIVDCEPKTYRPEVLTESAILRRQTTIIFAGDPRRADGCGIPGRCSDIELVSTRSRRRPIRRSQTPI